MPFTTELRFTLSTQELHNWCWAAVSQGVHQYLTHGPTLRQCEVASAFFGASCCADPTNFDKPQILGDPLQKILLDLRWDVEFVPRPLSFEEVAAEIDDGRPICAHIRWSNGKGGHFNVIYGYRISDGGHRLLTVSDPFYRDSVIQYDTYLNLYQDDGRWDQTLLVKALPRAEAV